MTIFANVTEIVTELKDRFRAYCNRWRHTELAMKYGREKDPVERFLIAQQMMMQDREVFHRGPTNSEIPYPIVWDYHIPPGRGGWKQARSRRSEREADLREIRQRLRPGRR